MVGGEVVPEPPEQVLLLAGQRLRGGAAQNAGETVSGLWVGFELALRQSGSV